MIELITDTIESPIGTIILIVNPMVEGGALCALDYEGYEERMGRLLSERYDIYTLRSQKNPFGFTRSIEAYLDGDLGAVEDIPVVMGGTQFQQSVWNALRGISAGTVRTYGELAAQLGNPGAARAVGLANSLNPIAIVVPCHRVIGASAKLTGYAGGLDRKQWLLEHEGAPIGKANKPAQESLPF